MLFTMRYKNGRFGVMESAIEASTHERAVKVAEAYCSQQPERRLIPNGVKPFVVADESLILQPMNQTNEVPYTLPSASETASAPLPVGTVKLDGRTKEGRAARQSA